MKFLLVFAEKLFDLLEKYWEHLRTQRLISSFLAIVFVFGTIVYLLNAAKLIHLEGDRYSHPFLGIELAFSALLIFELLSLVFTMPKSVAHSVGKQFELLSLIMLRSAFKEFGKVHHLAEWTLDSKPLLNMFIDGFGALAIFTIIGFSYQLQKHVRITESEDEHNNFIKFKKALGLVLLVVFFAIGVHDVKYYFDNNQFIASFNMFYTALIFSDILIVLIALRYTLEYLLIFRYSAFVLATIFIRLSLSLHNRLESVIVGVVSAMFIFLLTLTYNYFLNRDKRRKKPSIGN